MPDKTADLRGNEQPFLTQPFDVNGRNVLVTGGASGIGLAIVKQFLQAGANVLVNDIDADALSTVIPLLADYAGRAAHYAGDLSDPGCISGMVAATVASFGSLDVLVNNAGIYSPTPLDRLDPAVVERMFAVNVKGLLYLSAEAAKIMAPGSAIIHISSLGGVRPPFPGLSAYHATKGALDSLTRDMALEWGPKGIRVNSAAPGGIMTGGVNQVGDSPAMSPEQLKQIGMRAMSRPAGRMGFANDLSPVVLFLASPAARFINGQMILVDGGYYLA
jgi:3-oxoacyl-[acyl-carrier protein] reductase